MKHRLLAVFVLSLLSFFLFPQITSAHCDGLDGPVVTAARKALETGNVNLVLVWVQKGDEETIKKTFEHTLKVRELGEDAKKLADRFFFETLVRIHRAGEGAPFTGLKPAGRDLGPAIPAADDAIETGAPKNLLKILNEAVHSGLHKRFTKVSDLKNYNPDDVEAGREFVKAYVDYVHYAEGIFKAAQKSGHGNGGEHNDQSTHDLH